MLKTIFIILISLHGLIHSVGFVKAFNVAVVDNLLTPISRPIGMLWLVSGLGFILTAILLITSKNWWGFVAVPILLLSQIILILSWSDAKFGTLPNLIILIVAITNIGLFLIQNRFETIVRNDLAHNNSLSTELLTEDDIAHLPIPIQNYIRYTKSVGQPKVKSVRAVFIGGIRGSLKEPYMQIRSLQYNFYQTPSRYFYMTANKMGLPATGLHLYNNQTATFEVMLLNWLPIISAKGEKMNQAETVTLFNDMCFIAPATLIDDRISWELIDNLTVKATYTNGDISISAALYFNESGEMVNFISSDRFETDGKKYLSYPWKTPVSQYKEINGYLLPSKAKLIYEKPDGDFTYGELEFKDVRYNLNSFLHL